jgi:nicotinate-nucleotide pyrophosphorylase (carboxylating)
MDFLNHPETDRIIREALREDIHEGDHTSLACIPPDAVQRARCLVKEDGVIAGVALAERVFKFIDPEMRFERLISDGEAVKVGDVPFFVEGNARAILTGERTVLNCMQRMSGIATRTRQMVKELEGLHTKLLDTRKTTPLIRHLEKWAVTIGGGENHRFGLYDMIMVKDNHHDYAGGIEAAIHRVKEYQRQNGLNLKVEVEARNLEEVKEVLRVGGVDRIMFDNMSAEDMKAAVGLVAGRYETEASGNIVLENIREKALSGVDYLSMGALTHSVDSLDISLKAMK